VASLLFRKAERAVAPAARRSAIIDIGSNSIRLVVYDGPPRLPAVLFNEKVMAGLGRSLAQTGAIDATAMDMATTALGRFARLCGTMGVDAPRTVATAAVRDASNGAELIARAQALGLKVELLSGEEEAAAAANGVISAIPEADGIVGDLGGGSLELVRVKKGVILDRASFPLGVLRIEAFRKKGHGALDRQVAAHFRATPWLAKAQGLPFYMVGGSWRALARLDMHLSDYPLPIIHQYQMDPHTPQRLVRVLAHLDRPRLKQIPSLSGGRIGTLKEAAGLLSALVRHLRTTSLVVSAFGLREGLLFGSLSDEEKAIDPLIAACREEGERSGRFPEHGDLLHRWIAPLFADETPADARLRHAACLLADVAWRANPEYKAERGLEIAVHGNWVAIDPRGRAMLGQALFSSFGGGGEALPGFDRLCALPDLQRAVRWGLAMRLGQRLSGGVAEPLRQSSLALGKGSVELRLPKDDAMLYGDAVIRRHRQLAGALGLEAKLVG
jgi:exopolyphosphatase/guanosine-5'-triphosphate,3'-diphosphate pyrophosphatase